jgi:hypothetical protein
MVGVVDEEILDGGIRVHDHETVRASAAEHARDVAPQVQRVLDVAVPVTKPHDLPGADHRRGALGFHAPHRRQPLPH